MIWASIYKVETLISKLKPEGHLVCSYLIIEDIAIKGEAFVVHGYCPLQGLAIFSSVDNI